MALKVGITRFLGTNCDEDIRKWVLSRNHQAEYLWFEDRFEISDYDMVILPGGFSHGDYLRCGALAAHTPLMKSVKEFSQKGKPVLGICNGFQILCEAGLLPGALLRNDSLRFKDELTTLTFQNSKNPFTKNAKPGQKIVLPIAHGEGHFYADSEQLKKIKDNEQIWLTYEQNPNGSQMDIAGVLNETKNVCGLMPHPERALYAWMGSTDGEFFL